MPAPVRVTAFDHLVLCCTDVERTLSWYVDLLGLEPVRVDLWRDGRVPFPSVRVSADTIIDLIPGEPRIGRLDHLCLVVEPTDLDMLVGSGTFEIVDGPATRFGARGNGTSLYVLDPDGTVVELRHY